VRTHSLLDLYYTLSKALDSCGRPVSQGSRWLNSTPARASRSYVLESTKDRVLRIDVEPECCLHRFGTTSESFYLQLVANRPCSSLLVMIALRVWTKEKSMINALKPSFSRVRASLIVIVESGQSSSGLVLPGENGKLMQSQLVYTLPLC
jgi:hypothetical protein